LRGDLVGVGLIVVDGWLAVAHGTPILAACRELVRLGYPPEASLECFRGGKISLTVKSIGAAAELEINAKGDGFVKRPCRVRIASPMRSRVPGATTRPHHHQPAIRASSSAADGR
jgi:hypothetical protein